MNNSSLNLIVLFGATGDLAQRKIILALFTLFQGGGLGNKSKIIAFSRRPWSDADYRQFIRPSIKTSRDEKTVEEFLESIEYVEGTFDTPASYERLAQKITDIEKRLESAALVFYHLSIQPEFYELAVNGLGQAGLAKERGEYIPRLLIEKPFGHDEQSAQKLEQVIEQYFSSDAIYRIDHYLGKQGLENLLQKRMTDAAFEASLTKDQVAEIEFQIFESIDIEGRGEFYEKTGALRDVGQNHLLEMFATATMNMPEGSVPAENMQKARAEAIQALHGAGKDVTTGEVVHAQYEGYREEKDVAAESLVETYFSIMTTLTDPRWSGVKIILRGGKALAKRQAQIIYRFKDSQEKTFDIQGTSGFTVPDAYEILLKEALEGNKIHFVSLEEIIASWQFVDRYKEQFKTVPLQFYKKGYNF
jgi:glucose-6-phosphate 1-dehydrogenase